MSENVQNQKILRTIIIFACLSMAFFYIYIISNSFKMNVSEDYSRTYIKKDISFYPDARLYKNTVFGKKNFKFNSLLEISTGDILSFQNQENFFRLNIKEWTLKNDKKSYMKGRSGRVFFRPNEENISDYAIPLKIEIECARITNVSISVNNQEIGKLNCKKIGILNETIKIPSGLVVYKDYNMIQMAVEISDMENWIETYIGIRHKTIGINSIQFGAKSTNSKL